MSVFKHFSKSLIVGSKFARNILSLLVQKVILSELASVHLHWNFLPFKYNYVTFTHAAYWQDLTFLALSFNPEI